MNYHPDLAAALAEARAADLHDAAARGRHASSQRQVIRGSRLPLDAFPRLCGLAVTIERLASRTPIRRSNRAA